jgi:hypothetical protein
MNIRKVRFMNHYAWVSLEYRALPVVSTIIVEWQQIWSKEKHLFFRGYCNLDLCRQYKWYNSMISWLQYVTSGCRKTGRSKEKLSVGTIGRYRKCQSFTSTFRNSASYTFLGVRQSKNAIKYQPTPRSIPEERSLNYTAVEAWNLAQTVCLLFKRVAIQPKEDKSDLSLWNFSLVL